MTLKRDAIRERNDLGGARAGDRKAVCPCARATVKRAKF